MELDKQNIDTGQNEAMQSLPLKRKLAFAMGDIGNNFSWTFVSSYLMYFWTDVLGVSTGFSGTIMLISRFWDAVNDPIIGTMADRTRSRWGCYRPWILLAAVPLAIVNILAFTAFPIASQTDRN